ncbi:signal peptidase I [Nakamurella sp. YIM 132087]|uniref:Signal peptidase I n=1 Tax=Nakamurella alba TaxID=2665158 RepID=A0A7K1FR69_9ACTN|nr:signal peptidase I [Nakamurella alba]MTD15733.1 signal peptidase I [Nakamurella alba]
MIPTTTQRRSFPVPRMRMPYLLLGVGVLVLALAGLGWRLAGGNWLIVSTPSMGEAAPVGSLLITRPVDAAEISVGDIVTYHSPIKAGTTYTHRVVSIDASGGLHTKGDVNPAEDPWTLHTADLVGLVVGNVWGVGWFVRALPVLLVGGIVLRFATARWAGPRTRSPIRVMGSSLLFAVAAYLYEPFVRVVGIENYQDADGMHLSVVSTGLIPVRVSADTGGHVDLIDGRVGTVVTDPAEGIDTVHLTATVHLSWGWWALLVLLWLTPLWWALLVGDGTDRPRFTPGRHRAASGRRGARRAGVGAVAVIAVVAVATPATAAAFSAAVTNTANTAAANPWFTCRAAYIGTGAYFAYPLGDFTMGGSAADVSGNNRTGTYGGAGSASTTKGCARDTTGSVNFTSITMPGYVATPNTAVVNPTVFSQEIWFRTGTPGGRLIGFGNVRTGTTSGQYDRHLFMNNSGQLVFGIYNGGVRVVVSPATYADNTWHQAVTTLSSAGMRLYVDGSLVASDATATTHENFTGYWRVGWDNLSGWGTNTPTNFAFLGSLAYAAVYTTALTATQVRQHYAAGR